MRLAIVAGCSKRTIMRKHILPNVLNSAIVLGTLMLGVVIVTEAALSFLGVGVPPPQAGLGPHAGRRQEGPDGRLLVAHRAAGRAASCSMVLSANLLGDWLRVKLDPQLRQL